MIVRKADESEIIMKIRPMKNKIRQTSALFYTLAAFLPIFLMLAVYFILHQWPFGSKGLYAFPDSYSQYSNYFEYYRTLGQNGPFYSFSRTLGGDLVGQFTYYLLSPFNLLFLILRNVTVGKVMTLVTLLKFGAGGLTFSILLNHGQRKRFFTLIFSTSYALIGYLVIYSQNIIFMDAVVFLPLILLGIRLLIQKKQPTLYILVLAAALMIHYYTGYMLCLFAVLYFIYELLLSENLHKKEVISLIRSFTLSSLLSGGLSAITVIPALYSLIGGRGPRKLSDLLHFSSQFRTVDFLSRFNIGAFSWSDVSSTLPNIYSGLIMLALCMLFFCTRHIGVREKVLSAIFLLILFFSSKLYFLNTVWHCFNEPHGSPVRYSYMISCLVILFAYRYYTITCVIPENIMTASGVIHLEDRQCNRLKKLFTVCFPYLLSGLIFLSAAVLVYKHHYDYLTKSRFLLSVGIFAACYMILIARELLVRLQLFSRLQKCLIPLLGIICCLELMLNAAFTYQVFPFRDMDYQAEHIKTYQPAVSYVKNSDTGLYRMEQLTSVTTNDPMLFNYRGISHDSSFHKYSLQDFCDRMGLTSHGSIIHYDTNASLSTDCLLGVKYLLSETAPNSLYEPIHTTAEGVTVYQNPYTLPLMFCTDAITAEAVAAPEHPFSYQNAVFTALSGNITPVFNPCKDVRTSVINLDIEESDIGITYTVQNPDEVSYIEYGITAATTGPMYAFFQADVPYARLYVDDQEITSLNSNEFDLYFNGLVPLGEHNIGDTVTVRMELTTDRLPLSTPEFYDQDTTALAEDYQLLTEDTPKIRQLSNSRFEVQVDTAKAYLLFTVPYDKGWTVRVDGIKTNCEMAFDALMAVPLSEGSHVITMNYVPSGLLIGGMITLLSACMFVLFIRYRKRHQ